MNVSVCVLNDCGQLTVPGGIYCPSHAASVPGGGIIEPDVEAKVSATRTEDDLHPGERKVYDPITGKASWVPVEAPKLVGIDDIVAVHGQRRMSPPAPDFTGMEPHWDGTQWVLRPKQENRLLYRNTLDNVRSLVRELMSELGIDEADHDER